MRTLHTLHKYIIMRVYIYNVLFIIDLTSDDQWLTRWGLTWTDSVKPSSTKL